MVGYRRNRKKLAKIVDISVISLIILMETSAWNNAQVVVDFFSVFTDISVIIGDISIKIGAISPSLYR